MKYLPGAGFVLVFLTYSVTTIFVMYGLSQPKLERVWEIYHELKFSEISALSKKDQQLLTEFIKKYPHIKKDFFNEQLSSQINVVSEQPTFIPNKIVKRK